MADFNLPGILGPFADVAISQNAGQWISLAINTIVFTMVSGIILIVLLKVLESVWGENYDMGRAFLAALIITLINLPILGFLRSLVSFIPTQIFYILVWIALMKLFFGEMRMLQAVIAGVVAFLLTAFIAPSVAGYIISVITSIVPMGF
ncbi:MAG: hypothetical protein DRO99_01870 [Candidatus Aenigmatarchaeota archaeon]|nr:MAG: hypothetical protein DRO99_01870 [Candidatus Aenigmarchaeota archaeon]